MTVSTITNREQYATDGVTVAFTIHFPFFDDTDVNAIFVDSLGASTTLALSTDFSVTGGNGAGGTLTTMVAQANGGTLTVYRDIPFTQEDDYVEDDPLPAETLEGGFDRAAMRDQQLKDALDRALVLPVTATVSGGVVPSPEADKILGWNSDATALENKDIPAGTAVYSSIANTKLGTATTEAVTPDSLAALWQQGADIAAASTLVRPTDANIGGSHRIVGTTQINNFFAAVKDGEMFDFRHSGVLILSTAGNLLPPGNAAFTTIGGDMIRWRWDATASKWRAFGGMRADGTALVVTNTSAYTAVAVDTVASVNGATLDFTTAGHSATVPVTSGFKQTIMNSAATADVTITPASGTIDGLATRLLRPGDRVTVTGTGTVLKTTLGDYGYDSGEQTITAAALLTLAHGLGVVPTQIEVWARCKTNDASYVVGEEILLTVANTGTGFSTNKGYSVRRDATNIKIRIGSGGIGYVDATSGAEVNLTLADWKYIVRARAR